MESEPRYLIIPAAGLGTRMRYVNPNMPKEMLSVGHKPAIQYAVEEGFYAGIKDIVIIINKHKGIIRQYFEDSEFREKLFPLAMEEMEDIEKSCTITFLYQEESLGESDAIYLAEEIVNSHSMGIIYPDNIYFPAPGAMKILKAAFRKYKKDIVALTEVTEDNAIGTGNSGRVDIKPINGGNIFRIEKFHPKGHGHFVPSFKGELRTCGITITGSHIFNYIKKARKAVRDREFTDLPVRRLVLREKGIFGFRLPGRVFDIGNPRGYKLCLSHVLDL